MPGLMSVAEFVAETREDYNSPTTSSFVSKIPMCRQTVSSLEETLDFDRDGLTKMKKAVKAIFNSGNAHVDNEVYLSKALDRLGANAMTKDQEPDIGAAFIKFSIVTKELSALMKTLMQNLNNIIMFPLDNLLKGDLKGVKGDLKRPFDKAWKDYETKITKIEKEKKQQAKEAGLIRTEISPAEIAEEMEKERKIFQLQMCEYLIKVNEIKTKKGAELLQHLVEYYHAQNNYFQDGLKTIEHFSNYIKELATKLQKIRQKQDEERKKLVDLRNTLRNSPSLDSRESLVLYPSGYTPHQPSGNENFGYTKIGNLFKKSDGKVRKVWQKRRCEIRDGFLYISHSDENKPPTKLNLLTSQVKVVQEEKKCFDLISYNRTYHFQAEDENEMEVWMSVLVNCKEGALRKAFDDSGQTGSTKLNQSLMELQQGIIRQVQRLPGNDRCCDCNSTKDPTWLSTNFGILMCIECSGIHRDLGVHISRIQSLTLDNIGTSQLLLARIMSNAGFNDIVEATLSQARKPTPQSSMEERYEFIRGKYVDRKFAIRTCSDENDLINDLENAVTSKNVYQLLQAFVEGVDLTCVLPNSAIGETSLHVAVTQEDGNSLHIVDFLVQNSSSLDKQTKDGSTALHICSQRNQSECMKLLLRSGANPQIENREGKTPLDIAKEKDFHTCVELLEHAVQNKKTMFENVNIDWGLSQEDGSTDFSDEDGEENKGGQVTPEHLNRSRPSSVVGNESPTSRSSSISETVKQSPLVTPRTMPPPPPPQNKKPFIPGLTSHGSMKKRAAPPPPTLNSGNNCPATPCHSRTPSDPGLTQSPSGIIHRRNHSTDLVSCSSHSINSSSSAIDFNYNGNGLRFQSATITLAPGAKQVLPKTCEFPVLKSVEKPSVSNTGSLQRPKCPPPPTPPVLNETVETLSNGQSSDSLPQSCDSNSSQSQTPVPPPRKRHDTIKSRRCRALYDCDADREDELSFKEGEIITIISEVTDDDDWMEGMIEGQPERRGVFPSSFVHVLKE
ncbi:arfGAP with SH3 domain, ANK repeat and PH domain-containing protein [Trichonephila clavata]|uniref:ArfGAP with SH3 domain, ANK repeat and PH domain-containing protein n=1 Tax=Trichonephila clavata TaxID=2740835 RepID=A0A8X6M5Z2_TRICU|nr:arfGAP with SH3 domain, ANK repeat and PH domain-containing protein [Trichonephila clavata]